MRKCKFCLLEKPLEDFTRNHSMLHGRANICKPCNSKRSTQHRKEHYNQVYATKYKITLGQIEELFKIKTCAICNETVHRRRLSIDHCHTNGHVRGMLCDYCNKGLGQFKDSKELLQKAINYLENHNA